MRALRRPTPGPPHRLVRRRANWWRGDGSGAGACTRHRRQDRRRYQTSGAIRPAALIRPPALPDHRRYQTSGTTRPPALPDRRYQTTGATRPPALIRPPAARPPALPDHRRYQTTGGKTAGATRPALPDQRRQDRRRYCKLILCSTTAPCAPAMPKFNQATWR